MRSYRIIVRYLKRLDCRFLFLTTIFISSLLLLFSFGMPGWIGAEAISAENPEKAKKTIQLDELEQRIHDLVNQERKKQGLDTLNWNSRLCGIARSHSRDMASRNYFSHESPEGKTCENRYGQQGFTCRIAIGNGRYAVGGENIFLNNFCRSVTYIKSAGAVRTVHEWNNMEQLAQSTVAGWMNKPGHRKNILWPYWKTEGIGVAVSPDGKVYITQNFC